MAITKVVIIAILLTKSKDLNHNKNTLWSGKVDLGFFWWLHATAKRFLYKPFTWYYTFWPAGLYISFGGNNFLARVRSERLNESGGASKCPKWWNIKRLRKLETTVRIQTSEYAKYYSWIRTSKKAHTTTYEKLHQN